MVYEATVTISLSQNYFAVHAFSQACSNNLMSITYNIHEITTRRLIIINYCNDDLWKLMM